MRTDTLSNILGAIMLIAIGALGMFVYQMLTEQRDGFPVSAEKCDCTREVAQAKREITQSDAFVAGRDALARQLADQERKIRETEAEIRRLEKSGEDFLREMQGY